ncbi:50S ribosomal protein L3 [Candidatus Woesearchaeota archaeon]|nr:50S ribosomal protein L3P [uncultured archaeon]MBS3136789.1 50S ribosomal protein L3 [Candidatus Woesearchaeota archaeon]
MGQVMGPRHGSMQYWPRKRAIRPYPRVRSWQISETPKQAALLGFAGYKVGMTHVLATDNKKTSKTKGSEIFIPVTIIECPPIKIYSVRAYKKEGTCLLVKKEILVGKDKDLFRKVRISKKTNSIDSLQAADYDDIRVNVLTTPRLTGIGKKKPEIFELALSGSVGDKLAFVKNNIDKEIQVKDIFKEGQLLDFHAVTKGKGYQGPVKRFGVRIRSHKAEKTKRGPGSLGAWCGQGHMMYRVAHAGQMGYHTRTEYNKWLIKISSNPVEINPVGGFINYGVVRNPFILVQGSVAGNKKRLVRFSYASRQKKNIPTEAPKIEYISLQSQQGR